jgi:hypothetical protein
MIRWVEDTLVKDGMFLLSGRKVLLKSDAVYEVVLVDVAESSIKCPTRGKGVTAVGRKSGTL